MSADKATTISIDSMAASADLKRTTTEAAAHQENYEGLSPRQSKKIKRISTGEKGESK
jgi:hypothetical protein